MAESGQNDLHTLHFYTMIIIIRMHLVVTK